MMTINICIGSACHLKGSYNGERRSAGDDRGVGARGPVELTGVFLPRPLHRRGFRTDRG